MSDCNVADKQTASECKMTLGNFVTNKGIVSEEPYAFVTVRTGVLCKTAEPIKMSFVGQAQYKRVLDWPQIGHYLQDGPKKRVHRLMTIILSNLKAILKNSLDDSFVNL